MQHVVADYLSLLYSGEPGIGVQDDFPNAKLFRVETENTSMVNDDTTDLCITKMTVFPSIEWPLQRLAVRSQFGLG